MGRKVLFIVLAIVVALTMVAGCGPKAVGEPEEHQLESAIERVLEQKMTVVVAATPEPITVYICVFEDTGDGLFDGGTERLLSWYVTVYNTGGNIVDLVEIGNEKAEPFPMARDEVLQFVLLQTDGYEATTRSDVVVDGRSVLGRTSRIYFGLARIPTPTPTSTLLPTATLTATAAPTSTPEPTATSAPTATLVPTATPEPILETAPEIAGPEPNSSGNNLKFTWGWYRALEEGELFSVLVDGVPIALLEYPNLEISCATGAVRRGWHELQIQVIRGKMEGSSKVWLGDVSQPSNPQGFERTTCCLPKDFNRNGRVDGEDFRKVRDCVLRGEGCKGKYDLNGDGSYNQVDLDSMSRGLGAEKPCW